MVLTTTRRRPMNVRNPWDWFGRDFGDLLGPFTGADEDVTAAYPVDIREDNDHVTLEAELPGFTTDQIDVTLENGVLRIDAQRDAGETPEGEKTPERAALHARVPGIHRAQDRRRKQS